MSNEIFKSYPARSITFQVFYNMKWGKNAGNARLKRKRVEADGDGVGSLKINPTNSPQK